MKALYIWVKCDTARIIVRSKTILIRLATNLNLENFAMCARKALGMPYVRMELADLHTRFVLRKHQGKGAIIINVDVEEFSLGFQGKRLWRGL